MAENETRRPSCPRCGAPVLRTQHSQGVIAVYPCGCWLPARRDANQRPEVGQPGEG
jgi:hypothetical protein